MNSQSSADHPGSSDGGPGGGARGGREQEHGSKFKGMWRYCKKSFTRRTRPRPRNPQPPESQQTPNVHELPGSQQGPGYQHEGRHHHTQPQNRAEMPVTATVANIDDTMPPVGSPDDEIIIALMGVTGEIQSVFKTSAGKSYFIREVSSNPQVEEGTRKVQSYSFEYQGAKITLVDTPGFNDTNRSDTVVLREIANWTTETYRDDRLLSGIIYLHPITHSRMEGSSLRNLRMFRSLCGQKALENVLLTTTQWSNVDPGEGGLRETSLRQNQDFWGGLIDKGATLERFDGTRESGLRIIHRLIPNERKPLDIQEQIVEQNRTLFETDAGQRINEELIAQEKRHEEEIESLKKQWEEAMKSMKDEVENLLKEQKKAEKELEKVLAEKKLLEELHEEEVAKRKEREKREGGGDYDKAVIAVAINDMPQVVRGLTTYSAKCRLISDINKHEEFRSNTFRITIHYLPRNPSGVGGHTGTSQQMLDAGASATSYIIWSGVHYRLESGTRLARGGQNFLIFSRA
ncbi:unnamed protein product [Tuber aestivum]|uniref:G domain-containing protein n=1 Tax=Tuber aestivum TaxID=59557 RepID=A0A292PTG3_9PEZI|nr:unnamed protein product [Tuber aestivum]